MNRLTINLMAVALGVAFSCGAMAKDDYAVAKQKIANEYNSAAKACDSFADNRKDICMAEAKGHDSVARAELEASYKPSPKAHYNALIAKADADYAVTRERCDDIAGNAKDVCLKEAKAAETSAKANANVELKTAAANAAAGTKDAEANKSAKATASDARKDAVEEKTDAQYDVEKTKCEALAGDAKDTCLKRAKERFGKM